MKADEEISEGKLTGYHTGEKAGFAIAEFSPDITEKLLNKSSNAFGAKTDEVIIAGLSKAVGHITGQRKLSLKLEGHGREKLHEDISVDRTVGWFTNIYTVTVEFSEDNDHSIVNVKDTLRSVPDNGMGYGFVEHSADADICFNYLGDFTENNMTNQISKYSSGADMAPENVTNDKIVMNGHTAITTEKEKDIPYDYRPFAEWIKEQGYDIPTKKTHKTEDVELSNLYKMITQYFTH